MADPITLAIIAGAGAGAFGFAGDKAASAARQQEEDFTSAQDRQLGHLEGLYELNRGENWQGMRDILGQYGGQAFGALGQGYEDALGSYDKGLGAIEAGYGQAYGDLQSGGLGAQDTMRQGMAGARGDLQAGLAGGLGSLGQVAGIGGQFIPGATTSVGGPDLVGQSRLEQLRTGGVDLEMDPGYQFRLQQGEQAIGRNRAAKGGRGGGAAMKELTQFNQGLASQEYQNAFGRQAGLAQGVDALAAQQAGMGQQAALAAQRNQMGLAQQGLGALGQMGAMQYGGGQQLAGLGMGGAGQLAGLQMGLGQGLAGLGVGLGQGRAGMFGQMGGLGYQHGQGLAGMYNQMGSSLTGMEMQRRNNLMNYYQQLAAASGPNPYTGGQDAAWANTATMGIDLGAGFLNTGIQTAGQGAGKAAGGGGGGGGGAMSP